MILTHFKVKTPKGILENTDNFVTIKFNNRSIYSCIKTKQELLNVNLLCYTVIIMSTDNKLNRLNDLFSIILT